MGKELGNVNVVMINKCGNCGNGGHSSKECSEKVALKLFGVRIFEEKKRDELMKKSFSVENLQATVVEHGVIDRGYLSDGLVRSRRDRHGRKKGVPWTEEEHRTFLLGLKKLGKGDWRGISRKFVTTRTPTQVASHAQKYFLRQQVNSKKKRRSSLFDMPVVEDPPSPRSSEIAKLMETPRLEVPQASPMATCSGAINTHGTSNKEVIPGLMLRQSEARLFPTMKAFGNAAEFTNQFYRFLAKPSENFINSSGKPFVCQQLVPNCGSKMEGGGSSSSTVNTDLELTIAPPGGVHGPAKLLGDASKMGGIIQVI